MSELLGRDVEIAALDTLLAELARRAEAGGCPVLSGRGTELEGVPPFGLVVAALDGYVHALDARSFERLAPDDLGELAAVFPRPRPRATARRKDGAHGKQRVANRREAAMALRRANHLITQPAPTLRSGEAQSRGSQHPLQAVLRGFQRHKSRVRPRPPQSCSRRPP